MTIQCNNGCGATLTSVGKRVGKDGREWDIWVEVNENGETKKDSKGRNVNHFFDCPNKKPLVTGSTTNTQQSNLSNYYSKGRSAGGKTSNPEIKEMAEERTDAILEISKAILAMGQQIADAIRYHRDGVQGGSNDNDSEV